MISTNAIMDVLRTIDDPEMPISIVDLGLVEDVQVQAGGAEASVSIDILPTFVGCPALEMIARQITDAVSALDGVDRTNVRFVYDPPWSVDRISPAGRASLRDHGVTVPEHGSSLPVPGHSGGFPPGAVELRISAVKCPYCSSDQTKLESMFGPTRCRMIYYCTACRNSFEHMKKV
ncbi:MAG: phenylacetate-CoA oxygenase subunit PaaJ [Planctomycetes bacterium]|nr:phenylacetate-CoA oxygenase subunit PaaJ [Planctomycetota bacterium]